VQGRGYNILIRLSFIQVQSDYRKNREAQVHIKQLMKRLPTASPYFPKPPMVSARRPQKKAIATDNMKTNPEGVLFYSIRLF
jgi:hypothetical protein